MTVPVSGLSWPWRWKRGTFRSAAKPRHGYDREFWVGCHRRRERVVAVLGSISETRSCQGSLLRNLRRGGLLELGFTENAVEAGPGHGQEGSGGAGNCFVYFETLLTI
jgi:hypothetical protein